MSRLQITAESRGKQGKCKPCGRSGRDDDPYPTAETKHAPKKQLRKPLMGVPGRAREGVREDVPIGHASMSGDPAAGFDVPLDVRIADHQRAFQPDAGEYRR